MMTMTKRTVMTTMAPKKQGNHRQHQQLHHSELLDHRCRNDSR
jgi:hypothetical protein